MRLTKFRGKGVPGSKAAGKWVEGSLVILMDEDREDAVIKQAWNDLHSYTFHVFEESVGQFTGFKDENNKDIYEGDILLWHDELFENAEFRGRVFYEDAAFRVKIEEWYQGTYCPNCTTEELLMDVMDMNPEIIGNIYDTPEQFQSWKEEKK